MGYRRVEGWLGGGLLEEVEAGHWQPPGRGQRWRVAGLGELGEKGRMDAPLQTIYHVPRIWRRPYGGAW
jgi:hypothetical protein